MKRMSLAPLVCAAVLSAACNGKSNNPDQRAGTSGIEAQQSSASTVDATSSDGSRDRSLAADTTAAIGTSGVTDQGGSAGPVGIQGSGSASAGGNEQQFTQQAAVSGMAEVELGRLAQQRASDKSVKEFAGMMVRDHSKANDELKQVAKAQNIQLPTQLDQKHRDLMMRLQQLRGAEFDREYMRAMVEGHMEVRDLLSSQAGTGTQASAAGSSGAGGSQSSATGTSGRTQSGSPARVEQWASKTLPTVEHHLQEAQQISSRVQNNSAGGPSGSPRPSGPGSPDARGGAGSNGSGSGTSSSGR